MNIRQKREAVRIAFADSSKPQNIGYVLIQPSVCWSATFNAWGRKVETPIIEIGAKKYRVVLEEV